MTGSLGDFFQTHFSFALKIKNIPGRSLVKAVLEIEVTILHRGRFLQRNHPLLVYQGLAYIISAEPEIERVEGRKFSCPDVDDRDDPQIERFPFIDDD
eukprot:CAMPEP_0115019402 /NCGR_PEP_ID=MMETSP0216-20121206/29422_1 /TAXON_ID=223996 /ORGANISM="Protocruzia adherens, Strain Boccale" /LENGTH=97 /DNA_ID=CAMNT_0002390865 /DNA_START=449 /DNA_END=742 /DNA_ORIENTATION=-